MILVPHHQEAPGCEPNKHCWIHDVDEPEEGAFRVCGECFHVFMTAEELIQADSKWYEDGRRNDPERIWSCPLCTHDF